jgi:hypothetical protein
MYDYVCFNLIYIASEDIISEVLFLEGNRRNCENIGEYVFIQKNKEV